MKKIILGLLIFIQSMFSISIFSGIPVLSLDDQLQTLVANVKRIEQEMQTLQTNKNTLSAEEQQSKKAKIQKAILTTLNKIGAGLKFAFSNSDKIFSKKFLATSLLLLGPIVTLYCKFFGSESLTTLLNFFILSSSHGIGTLFSIFGKGFKKGAKDIIKDVIETKMDIEAEISSKRFGAGWKNLGHLFRTKGVTTISAMLWQVTLAYITYKFNLKKEITINALPKN